MEQNSYNSLAVYKKSIALRDLSSAIALYFSKDNDAFTLTKTAGLRHVIANSLVTDASLISTSIQKAYETSCFTSRINTMKHISIMTRNILSYCNGLEQDGIKEKEYIYLLRREIKLFRRTFKQWRKSLVNSKND
ncbi:hypothetical protein [Flavobacterium sp. ASW18X]|uniref:hypothetical protein n=1 Tax=Flavobacterium sp. ASW18X TaxID=2572595 RepID=UPI0010AE7DFC|nr:hypothetical protein [Flavobacterium sp. ASW18X]TKD61385.1 hypothetical protein FBT53_11415 [Flavobacterium sp. ASW18X]